MITMDDEAHVLLSVEYSLPIRPYRIMLILVQNSLVR